MPVSLANVQSRRALATKDLGEFGELNVWFNVAKLTPGYFQAKRDAPSREYLAEMTLDLVLDWDITDETGEKIPITSEVINGLDYHLLDVITDMVKEASDPLMQSVKR